MQANINTLGKLTLIAENDIESYAAGKWFEQFVNAKPKEKICMVSVMIKCYLEMSEDEVLVDITNVEEVLNERN